MGLGVLGHTCRDVAVQVIGVVQRLSEEPLHAVVRCRVVDERTFVAAQQGRRLVDVCLDQREFAGAKQQRNHGHGQGRSWTAGWWHAITPHSHDSADGLDTALETSKRGMRTLTWSFVALFVTAVAQLVLVLLTGSVALLGDTLHNFATR